MGFNTLGTIAGVASIAGALAEKENNRNLNNLLSEIFSEFKNYKVAQSNVNDKIKNLEIELEKSKMEFQNNKNISKLEKMKKQMDLMIAEENLKQKQGNSDELVKLEEKINLLLNKIEKIISIAVRTTDTKHFIYTPELKKVYDYYKNAREVLKNSEEKLNMLEELIDEMAAEVIREDMKKNNVTLPEFVKGMRYFKPEDEE